MTTDPWAGALTADDLRAWRRPCRCTTCEDARAAVFVGRPWVPVAATDPIPARSRIGTAIAVVFGVAFIAGGVTAGLSTDTINGARIGALLLIAAGGTILARLAIVTGRYQW